MRRFQWPRIFRRHRRKTKPQTGLVVKAAPKKRKTEPDVWVPPFSTKKEEPVIFGKQDLVIVDEPQDFDLGTITASVGIMIQTEMDSSFKGFINESLERYSNLDWGGLKENEGRMNDRRVMTQSGIVCGVYTHLRTGVQIWIATDLDRGLTRICLAEER